MDCNLDQELKLFVSRHSARFSADVKGKQYKKRHFLWLHPLIRQIIYLLGSDRRSYKAFFNINVQIELGGKCNSTNKIIENENHTLYIHIMVFAAIDNKPLYPPTYACKRIFCSIIHALSKYST